MTTKTEWNEMQNKAKSPPYYIKGIQTWDYIYSHKMGYLEGNIVKYVTRYEYKNGLEDLYKAREYLNKLIEYKEKSTILATSENNPDD